MVQLSDPDQTKVIHRDLNRKYATIVRAEGVYYYDDQGRRYLDGSGGSSSVTNIGHGVKEVADAVYQQISTLAYAPTHAFSTEPIEALAKLIVEEFAPEGMDRVWFVSGGSEAVESAIKMALQYHRDRGQPTKHQIISRWSSYHGSTFGAMAVSGNMPRRRKFVPMLPPSEHIPPCFPYRCWASPVCQESGCDLSCAHYLEHTIRQLGPENVAAFIAEPVVGATLSAQPATPGYFQEIRRICDQVRRALHRRRGDDRLRPHRRQVRDRPLGRRPRFDRVREGHGRRLRPARRRHRQTRDRRRGAADDRYLPRRPHRRW
jgi:adenosylmethionine-8-amino-7-oxononanoate aminotransferase